MADHIPFLTSEDGCSLIKRVYADSAIVRVPVDRAAKLLPMLPTTAKIWIDPCVDGMDDIEIRRVRRRDTHGVVQTSPHPWFSFMSTCAKFEEVATSLSSPLAADVTAFVFAILDKCAAHNPEWITVPQVPLVDGSERNKVNRLMASAAGKWKVKNGCSGQFILPLVFTNQRQVNGKTARTPRVKQVERLYHESCAEGLWMVDKSLCDDSGAGTLRDTRVPGIIDMHEELNTKIPARIRIAGPYWALNLVLWARGLVDYPAIGIGAGYQYFFAGGPAQQGDVRLPLPALRRRAIADPQLRNWLGQVVKKLSTSHPAHSEFGDLLKNFTVLSERDRAREHLAKFYKTWYELIASTPKSGRSIALYQDLSAAFALGKPLPDIPSDKTQAKRPEAVAAALMLSCI